MVEISRSDPGHGLERNYRHGDQDTVLLLPAQVYVSPGSNGFAFFEAVTEFHTKTFQSEILSRWAK